MTTVAGSRGRLPMRWQPRRHVIGRATAGGRRKCRMSRLQCRGMNKPPSRYDVTVRVAGDDGHPPGPAAFAVTASGAASSVNASVISAHTAKEIICAVGVAAPDRASAVAVALAVVAGALTAEDPVRSPSRWAAGARGRVAVRRTPSAGAGRGSCCTRPGHVPCRGRARLPPGLARRGTASSSPAPCRATAGDRTGRIQACSRTEKRTSKRSCSDRLPRVNDHRDVHG
jgi:hypothetical protein